MATENLELTAEMLGASLRIPKADAYGLIMFGEKKGWIRKIGNMPSPNGRGRGASIYSIPVDFGAKLAEMWADRKGVQ